MIFFCTEARSKTPGSKRCLCKVGDLDPCPLLEAVQEVFRLTLPKASDMGGSSGSTRCHDRDAPALWSTPLVGLVPAVSAMSKHRMEDSSLLPRPHSLCSAVGTSV